MYYYILFFTFLQYVYNLLINFYKKSIYANFDCILFFMLICVIMEKYYQLDIHLKKTGNLTIRLFLGGQFYEL